MKKHCFICGLRRFLLGVSGFIMAADARVLLMLVNGERLGGHHGMCASCIMICSGPFRKKRSLIGVLTTGFYLVGLENIERRFVMSDCEVVILGVRCLSIKK